MTGSKCTNCGFILYDEHQCANCGYYDTEEETKWDTEVEKSYKFSKLEFVLRVIMIGGVGLIFALLLFWVISGLGYLASIWSGKGFYIPLILCFILWATFMFVLISTDLQHPESGGETGPNSPWSVEREVSSREISSVRYECNECGNRWRVR